MIRPEEITAIVLAGGKATRMGGIDKGLHSWQNKPLIEHVLSSIQPQCHRILINANRNIDHYRRYGFVVVSDETFLEKGPLAGIVNAARAVETHFVVVIPCDVPLIPANYVFRLSEAMIREQGHAVYAHDGQQTQPLLMMVTREHLKDMQHYLESGQTKVMDWLRRIQARAVDFSDQTAAFTNINTIES